MTRQQRIVLSSVLLVLSPLSGFAECGLDRCHSQDPSIGEAQPAIPDPCAAGECVTVVPGRTTERTGFPPRPVMLMAGVGIALGLLIRTVKVRSI